jgi:hypothetical protein
MVPSLPGLVRQPVLQDHVGRELSIHLLPADDGLRRHRNVDPPDVVRLTLVRLVLG